MLSSDAHDEGWSGTKVAQALFEAAAAWQLWDHQLVEMCTFLFYIACYCKLRYLKDSSSD